MTRVPSSDLFALTLAGGGMDWACRACLPEARRDRGDALLGTAPVDDPDAYCVYCGLEASDG